MKRIFETNAALAHAWAHQLGTSGYTPNRNFRFEGKTIYSYGDHFPIATIMPDGKVQFTSRGYSVTTNGKHIPAARSAVSHVKNTPSCHTPFKYGYNGEASATQWKTHISTNAEEFFKDIDAHINLVQQSVSVRQLVKRQGNLTKAVAAAQSWCDYTIDACNITEVEWGEAADAQCHWNVMLRDLTRAINSADSWLGDTVDDAFKEMLSKNKDARAKQIKMDKEYKQRIEAERVRTNETRLAEWREGKNVAMYGMDTVALRWRIRHHSDGRNPEEFLETSKGVRIPKDTALFALRLWKTGKIVGMTVDNKYKVTHNADGILKAGCHTITWDEMQHAIDTAPIASRNL